MLCERADAVEGTLDRDLHADLPIERPPDAGHPAVAEVVAHFVSSRQEVAGVHGSSLPQARFLGFLTVCSSDRRSSVSDLDVGPIAM